MMSLSLLFFMIIYYLFWILFLFKNQNKRIIFFLTMIIVFILAIINTSIKSSKNIVFINNIKACEINVIEEIKSGKLTNHTTGVIKRFKYNEIWRISNLKLKLYINKNLNLKYGDTILINKLPVKNSKNPYDHYLIKNNIFFKQFLNKSEDYLLIKNNIESKLHFLAIKIKTKLISIFTKFIQQQKVLGIICALILGSKNLLKEESIELYKDTGVIHILALSGLHLGIIISICSFLLSLLIQHKKYKNMKYLLIISSIWIFAFITGLSSSIIRAALMFTIYQISIMLGKKPNIYYTISFACGLILLKNPFLINNIGFQLSFLSVLGIVYYQPKIYKLLSFQNKIGKFLWNSTSYTISVQLATIPLTIYYFNQINLYSFISNLFMIPTAFIVICLSLFILIFNQLNSISYFLGYIISKIIFLTNILLMSIKKLPYSNISNFNYNLLDITIIYLILISIILLQRFKKFIFIILLFFLVSSNSIYRILKVYKKHKIINSIIINSKHRSSSI
ncbi:MAG: ComEC/Rec2 family competence protein [Bacteroidetes bacterium]|nr:ComEC/Rec2 family competence protein [Bacteroidota bacterium]